jgi:hypothetical protein
VGKWSAIIAFVMAPVLAVALCLFVIFFGSAPANACGVGAANQIDVDAIAEDAAVGGFGREQIVNAAYIANASIALGLPAAAQTLGIQTAIGESGLRVIDYGDGAGPDSRGLFQQRDNGAWGSYEDRMDPFISATNFFKALQKVEGWEELEPSLAINRVQRNSDPYHYVRYRDQATAIMTFLTGSPTSEGCSVSGDAKELATGLVAAIEEGRLRLLQPSYEKQIRDVAAGTDSEDCHIDPRILQIITISLQNFGTVGVSDLNRKCTGSLLGAGTNSAHYRLGGGRAVDFFSLDGRALTGGDGNSIRLLQVLDPMVPEGARAGQINCRGGMSFEHFTQFNDTCNHLHLDVGYTDGPVVVS